MLPEVPYAFNRCEKPYVYRWFHVSNGFTD